MVSGWLSRGQQMLLLRQDDFRVCSGIGEMKRVVEERRDILVEILLNDYQEKMHFF